MVSLDDEMSELLKRCRSLRIEDEDLDQLIIDSFTFYKLVVDIYDVIIRTRNVEEYPDGFKSNDAAILGLLVRAWKIFSESIKCYVEKNGDMLSILSRPLTESIVMAKFLMVSSDDVIEDYRKCSYRDRLEILEDLMKKSDKDTEAHEKRLKASIEKKLENDGFALDAFGSQVKNRWKINGKNFYDIFQQVEHKDTFKIFYGMNSESIHGSWNHSLDYDLIRNDNNTYIANPFSYEPDARMISPVLRILNEAFYIWIERVNINSLGFKTLFDWIASNNTKIIKYNLKHL